MNIVIDPQQQLKGLNRAGDTDHEHSCIHEPIGQHTVVPFKKALLESKD